MRQREILLLGICRKNEFNGLAHLIVYQSLTILL